MQTGEKVRDTLTQGLKSLSADHPQMMRLVDEVAKVNYGSVLGFRWWVRGVPAVDQLGVVAIAKREQISSIIKDVLTLESLAAIDVFPYGIPNPEVFEIEARFGNVARQNAYEK